MPPSTARSSPSPRAEPVGGSPAASSRWPHGHWLVTAVDRFDAALLTCLSVVLGIMACVAMAQVLARYVFGQPLVWSEELMRYTLIWLAFLGAGVGVRKGMLVSVEIVVHSVPAALGRLAQWVTLLVSAIFWLVLIAYGIKIMGSVQGMKSGALELPMSYVYLAVPLGAAIALLNTLVVALDPPAHHIERGAS